MDDNLKSSIFNYIVHDTDKTIMYNSYTGRILQTNKKETVSKILQGEHCTDELLKRKMMEYGYIVSETEDEKSKGLLKYYDRIFDRTLSLTILATEQCNFRCKYCYENFVNGKIKQEVLDGIIKYLQKNMSSYSGLSISWFGGEPLLALDKIEYFSKKAIEICKKAKKPYLAGMTTNGYLLNENVFRQLLKWKVYNYQITLDGIEESHDKYRVLVNGGKTFKTILNNLRQIRDNIKTSAFKIDIRANITWESYQYIEQFIELMKNEFEEDHRFNIFFRPVGDWGGESVNTMSESLLQSSQPILDKVLKYSQNEYFSTAIYEELLGAGVCYAAIRNNFIIGSTGTIYKCTLHFEKELNKIGQVNDNGHFDINLSKLARWITPSSTPEKCISCFFFHGCPGGQCAAQRFIKGDKKNIDCGYEINNIESLLRLICNSHSKLVEEY